MSMKNGLDRVSDLTFWLSKSLFVMEQNRGWCISWKIKLKWNCEISRVKMLFEVKSTSSEVENLSLLLMLSGMSMFSLLFLVFKA